MVSLLRLPRSATTLSLLLALGACATGSPRGAASPGEGRLITAAQIQRSGATDAWDVVRRNAPSLEAHETSDGRPARMSQRGRASLVLDEAPVVSVDGVQVSDISVLQTIPADHILSIRILSGTSATKYFGTGASGGAIVVLTKRAVGDEVNETAVRPD